MFLKAFRKEFLTMLFQLKFLLLGLEPSLTNSVRLLHLACDKASGASMSRSGILRLATALSQRDLSLLQGPIVT